MSVIQTGISKNLRSVATIELEERMPLRRISTVGRVAMDVIVALFPILLNPAIPARFIDYSLQAHGVEVDLEDREKRQTTF